MFKVEGKTKLPQVTHESLESRTVGNESWPELVKQQGGFEIHIKLFEPGEVARKSDKTSSTPQLIFVSQSSPCTFAVVQPLGAHLIRLNLAWTSRVFKPIGRRSRTASCRKPSHLRQWRSFRVQRTLKPKACTDPLRRPTSVRHRACRAG